MPSSNDSASDSSVRTFRPASSRVEATTVEAKPTETIVRFNPKAAPPKDGPVSTGVAVVREIGGRKDGTEPTRYGDWEKNGRCIDF